MGKSLNDWSRKELLALPYDSQRGVTICDSVLVMKIGRKHDSGFGCIALVSVSAGVPTGVLARCPDDIRWIFGPGTISLQTDLLFRSGAVNFWGHQLRFKVTEEYSSIDVYIIKRGE